MLKARAIICILTDLSFKLLLVLRRPVQMKSPLFHARTRARGGVTRLASCAAFPCTRTLGILFYKCPTSQNFAFKTKLPTQGGSVCTAPRPPWSSGFSDFVVNVLTELCYCSHIGLSKHYVWMINELVLFFSNHKPHVGYFSTTRCPPTYWSTVSVHPAVRLCLCCVSFTLNMDRSTISILQA